MKTSLIIRICTRAGILCAVFAAQPALASADVAGVATPVVPAVAAPAVAAPAALPAARAVLPAASPAPVPLPAAVPAPALGGVSPVLTGHAKVKVTRGGGVSVSANLRTAKSSPVRAKAKIRVRVRVRVRPHIRLFSDTPEPECTDTFPKSNTEVYKCKNQPLDTQQTNECNNDEVQLHGWFQYSIKTITDPLTSTVTIYEKLKWQHVTGYALQDLNPYAADDKEKTFQTQQQLFLGFRYVTDHSQSEKLVSQGSDPDMFVKIKTHTVVIVDFSNPLNPVTVVDESQSGPGVTCKGDEDDD